MYHTQKKNRAGWFESLRAPFRKPAGLGAGPQTPLSWSGSSLQAQHQPLLGTHGNQVPLPSCKGTPWAPQPCLKRHVTLTLLATQNCKSISQILTWRKSRVQLPVIWPNRIPLYKCSSFPLPPSADQEARRTQDACFKDPQNSIATGLCIFAFPFLRCFIPIVCDQPCCLLPRFFNL